MTGLTTENKVEWGHCRCSCHSENPGPKKMHVCVCTYCPSCGVYITGSIEEHRQEAHGPEETKNLCSAEQDFSICDCDCHKHKNIKHAIACCSECEWCGQRIKTGFKDMHKIQCPGTITSAISMPTGKRIVLMVEHSRH